MCDTSSGTGVGDGRSGVATSSGVDVGGTGVSVGIKVYVGVGVGGTDVLVIVAVGGADVGDLVGDVTWGRAVGGTVVVSSGAESAGAQATRIITTRPRNCFTHFIYMLPTSEYCLMQQPDLTIDEASICI